MLLLTGIGISSLGDFIYLVAINILVIQMTGSPAAVAGLWIMSPIAAVFTQFWAGTVIDRINQRKLMIVTDIIRAVLIAVIPFMSSIWFIYIFLFCLSVAKAFFGPASISYMTSLISEKQRKQFNSFRSLITSGAFLVGPAVAGALLLVTTASIAIWINAASFLVSAFILLLLPDIDQAENRTASQSIRLLTLKRDWQEVLLFSKNNAALIHIYLLAQFFMVIALGMDAQEVVFTQQVLGLSETDFGLLISITGIGSIAGAGTVAVLARKLTLKTLIGSGYVLVAAGYLIYAFSFSFWSIAFGFIILGFFNAFSNTGLMTFYQNNVPLPIMGRITSVYGTFQSILQIIFIMLIGFTGEIFPLRYSIVAASILMAVISLAIILLVHQTANRDLFRDEQTLPQTK
ncbi:MFS transporter [Sediminibacillus albus]|uniref:Major Facilitator Superfamily protein n=1 Tax=Sediminibacillus albus TaxID=407036 RepID=A0A1G8X2Q6_9BACI|nr:MFS transporter [Sediminibacillus albus]SDJ84734.1 Major Facilitator Superfamily protein [Sediminibacillus albus]